MILVTRPKQFAARSSLELKKLGHPSLILPMLHTRYIYKDLVDKDYEAVIFTSKNAALATAHIKWLKYKKVYAVGSRTAKLLVDSKYLNVTAYEGDQNNSLGLMALIKEHEPLSSKILYISGADVAHNIAISLNSDGYNISREIVYESLMTQNLSHQAIDSINSLISTVLLYSPRSSSAFSQLVTKYKLQVQNKRAICISDNTAYNIEPKLWQELKIAPKSTEEAMFALI